MRIAYYPPGLFVGGARLNCMRPTNKQTGGGDSIGHPRICPASAKLLDKVWHAGLILGLAWCEITLKCALSGYAAEIS
jgi:hypothetical protein